MTSSYREAFRYELLDADNNLVRELRTVEPGGSFDANIHARIRSSSSFRMMEKEPIDWLTSRVRITYVLDGQEIPLITGIPAITDETTDSTGTSLQVDVYDYTALLADDSFGFAYSLPAGTNIVEAVRTIVSGVGAQLVSIPTSTTTLANPRTWEEELPKLTIVNELLDAAGYLALYADGMGWLRADPYVEPAARPRAFQFEGRQGDLYLPQYGRDYNPFEVPNRVVVVGSTDGDTPPPHVTVTDEREENPYSYLNRRVWRTETETGIEAPNLAAYGARRLAEMQQSVENHEVSHKWNGAPLNSAGTFAGRLVVLQKSSQRLSVGGLVTSTVRTIL